MLVLHRQKTSLEHSLYTDEFTGAWVHIRYHIDIHCTFSGHSTDIQRTFNVHSADIQNSLNNVNLTIAKQCIQQLHPTASSMPNRGNHAFKLLKKLGTRQGRRPMALRSVGRCPTGAVTRLANICMLFNNEDWLNVVNNQQYKGGYDG